MVYERYVGTSNHPIVISDDEEEAIVRSMCEPGSSSPMITSGPSSPASDTNTIPLPSLKRKRNDFDENAAPVSNDPHGPAKESKNARKKRRKRERMLAQQAHQSIPKPIPTFQGPLPHNQQDRFFNNNHGHNQHQHHNHNHNMKNGEGSNRPRRESNASYSTDRSPRHDRQQQQQRTHPRDRANSHSSSTYRGEGTSNSNRDNRESRWVASMAASTLPPPFDSHFDPSSSNHSDYWALPTRPADMLMAPPPSYPDTLAEPSNSFRGAKGYGQFSSGSHMDGPRGDRYIPSSSNSTNLGKRNRPQTPPPPPPPVEDTRGKMTRRYSTHSNPSSLVERLGGPLSPPSAQQNKRQPPPPSTRRYSNAEPPQSSTRRYSNAEPPPPLSQPHARRYSNAEPLPPSQPTTRRYSNAEPPLPPLPMVKEPLPPLPPPPPAPVPEKTAAIPRTASSAVIGMPPDPDPKSKRGVYHPSTEGPQSTAQVPNPARTLVLEQLPKSHRGADFITAWARKASGAQPIHVEVDKKNGKALVEFSTSELARAAWGSPRLADPQGTGKKRSGIHLIRVWWYRVEGVGADSGVGEIEEGEIEGDVGETPVIKETKKEKKARLARERAEAVKVASEAEAEAVKVMETKEKEEVDARMVQQAMKSPLFAAASASFFQAPYPPMETASYAQHTVYPPVPYSQHVGHSGERVIPPRSPPPKPVVVPIRIPLPIASTSSYRERDRDDDGHASIASSRDGSLSPMYSSRRAISSTTSSGPEGRDPHHHDHADMDVDDGTDTRSPAMINSTRRSHVHPLPAKPTGFSARHPHSHQTQRQVTYQPEPQPQRISIPVSAPSSNATTVASPVAPVPRHAQISHNAMALTVDGRSHASRLSEMVSRDQSPLTVGTSNSTGKTSGSTVKISGSTVKPFSSIAKNPVAITKPSAVSSLIAQGSATNAQGSAPNVQLSASNAQPSVQKKVWGPPPIAASSSSGPRSMVDRRKELEARIAKNKAELEAKRVNDESRAAEMETRRVRDESRAAEAKTTATAVEMETKDENAMVVDEPVAPVSVPSQKTSVSAHAKVFVPASAKAFIPAIDKVFSPASIMETSVGAQAPVAASSIAVKTHVALPTGTQDACSGSGHVDQRREMEEKLRSLVLASKSKKVKSNVQVAKPIVEQPLETGKQPVPSPVVATSQVVNTVPHSHQTPPPPPSPPRIVSSSTLNTAPPTLLTETKTTSHPSADTTAVSSPHLDDLAIDFLNETLSTLKQAPQTEPAPASAAKLSPPVETKADLVAKQKQLAMQIAESKRLMEKFSKASSKQERDAILTAMRASSSRISEAQEASDIKLRPSQPATPVLPSARAASSWSSNFVYDGILEVSDDEED